VFHWQNELNLRADCCRHFDSVRPIKPAAGDIQFSLAYNKKSEDEVIIALSVADTAAIVVAALSDSI